MLRAVAFAALVVYAQASRAASAAARAEQWMQAHKADPNDQAGMNDLKASDPNAFAIVQALLAKQQLGLLDPKHPTANFAGGHKHEDDDSQSALDVLRAAPHVEAPMAAVATAAHTYSASSMWDFKAHQKNEDDDLVNSVMGDVVGSQESPAPVSTGSLLSSGRSTVQSSALNGDMATFGFGGQHSMANAEAQEAERPAPVAHRSLESDGMPNLDWGSRYAGSAPAEQPQPQPEPATASMSQQMSSVTAVAQPIAQPVAQPAPVQKQAANPYLNGIDFSSDMSAQTKKASMAQQKLKTHKATPAELASNPYLQGIDLGQPAPAAQPQIEAPKPEASLSQKASYLDQIGFPMPHRRIQQEAPQTPRSLANPLTDFSWHGEDRVAAGVVQTNMMQKVEEGVTAAKISGPLSDWMYQNEEGTPSSRPITAQIQEEEPPKASVDPMAMDKYNDWVKFGQ